MKTIHQSKVMINFDDALCLTSQEWRNYIARGYIRILVNRICAITGQDSLDSTIFCVAPNVNLEDSSDHIVVSLTQDWRSLANIHPLSANPSIIILPIKAALSFHPVQQKDFDFFEIDANRAMIRIDSPRFVGAWQKWVSSEACRSADASGKLLARLVKLNITEPRDSGVPWKNLAQVILSGNGEISFGSSPLEKLLPQLDEILDIARGESRSASHILTAAVAWTERAVGNVLTEETVPTVGAVSGVVERWRDIKVRAPEAIGIVNEPEFASLINACPAAFDNELTPVMLSSILRLFHRARNRRLKPEELLIEIRSVLLTEGDRAAMALAYVIGCFLPVENIHALHMQLLPKDFPVSRPQNSESIDSDAGVADSSIQTSSESLPALAPAPEMVPLEPDLGVEFVAKSDNVSTENEPSISEPVDTTPEAGTIK